jgi:KipI family sensor histidine kinase inhibitor
MSGRSAVHDPMRRPAAEGWPPVIRPFGDTAVLVELEGESSLRRAARVHQVAAWIADRCRPTDGWGCPVPGATSVLVPFDPISPGPELAAERLRDVLAAFSAEAVGDAWPASPPVIEIRVRYGGQSGPDLEAVAAASGLPPDDVVLLHASRIYRVLFLGFIAGFAYCGTLPAELALPRRGTPRTRVEAGSVVIAGRMTGVLPVETPSGWHVIGRTGQDVWDPARRQPAMLQPGDAVRFVPEVA